MATKRPEKHTVEATTSPASAAGRFFRVVAPPGRPDREYRLAPDTY